MPLIAAAPLRDTGPSLDSDFEAPGLWVHCDEDGEHGIGDASPLGPRSAPTDSTRLVITLPLFDRSETLPVRPVARA